MRGRKKAQNTRSERIRISARLRYQLQGVKTKLAMDAVKYNENDVIQQLVIFFNERTIR